MDYSNLGLNKNLRSANALSEQSKSPSNYVGGFNFDTTYEVQAKTIRAGRLNITQFVGQSGAAAATGAFTTGQRLNLQTSLTPNPPFASKPNLAIPSIAVYQGTVIDSDFQIYPYPGGSIGVGLYNVSGGLDWNATDNIDSVWSGYVENVSAGSVSITFVSSWKYADYIPNSQS